MSAPHTALGALLYDMPLLPAVSADFKKRTITLELPRSGSFQTGLFLLVEEAAARQAMADDASRIVGPFMSVPWTQVEVITSLDDLGMRFEKPGYLCTVYHHRRGWDRPHDDPPGTWWGRERFTDAKGVDWERSLKHLVMDDFGFLVEVTTL